MIANHHRRAETWIQTAHHSAVPRPGADDPHVSRKLFDQQALAIAVRVHDDDFRCARCFRRTHCGERFVRHEATKAVVLESRRSELIRGDDTRDAFHVHRNEHFRRRR